MTWPIPSKLRFAGALGPLDALAVEVRLLDGQEIHGVMPSGENLSEMSALKLLFRGHDIVLAISDIRSVASSELLVPITDSDLTAAAAQPIEHEEEFIFHALFINGETLDGRTSGYLNLRSGGVYLYVQQGDLRFKAIWIARNSLQSIHINAADKTLATAVPAQPSVNASASAASASAATPDQPALRLASNMEELAAMLEDARAKPMISAARALYELDLVNEATCHELLADKSGKLRAYIDDRLAKSDRFKLQLDHARAYMVKTPEVNADIFQVEPAALARIGWQVAAQQSVVPLGMIAGTLYLASPVPMSRELEDRLNMIIDSHLALVWASEAHVNARLAREIQANRSLPNTDAPARVLNSGLPEADAQDLHSLLTSAQNEIKVEGAEVHSNAIDERSSVVRLVRRIITDANKRKASDIHIETNPGDQASRVRFRIDGDLEEYLRLPVDLRAALVSRIKVMSKLDISERRRPQDGKINFADFSDIKLELRVAILPTHDNLEDVVMRLLASSKPIPLAQLGFSARDVAIVSRMAQRPYGMILACGPTGSGKTTTLHSLLSEINTENRKIWTAEDPIEITQPGLRQLQVNPKIGVTFASAMRAFLRADPDVIMIGEIRDEETAHVAVEASLTGHLVLSTLHTNNAAESIVRLLDLGMDPMNFSDSLVAIVAQRLVRALCNNCKVKEPLSGSEFDGLVGEYVEGTLLPAQEARKRLLQAGHMVPGAAMHLYRPVGCELCGGKGYKGRMGIYETLENSAELKQLIQKRAATNLIFEQAIASGTRTLKQDALEKAFAGTIDHKQAVTVCS